VTAASTSSSSGISLYERRLPRRSHEPDALVGSSSCAQKARGALHLDYLQDPKRAATSPPTARRWTSSTRPPAQPVPGDLITANGEMPRPDDSPCEPRRNSTRPGRRARAAHGGGRRSTRRSRNELLVRRPGQRRATSPASRRGNARRADSPDDGSRARDRDALAGERRIRPRSFDHGDVELAERSPKSRPGRRERPPLQRSAPRWHARCRQPAAGGAAGRPRGRSRRIYRPAGHERRWAATSTTSGRSPGDWLLAIGDVTGKGVGPPRSPRWFATRHGRHPTSTRAGCSPRARRRRRSAAPGAVGLQRPSACACRTAGATVAAAGPSAVSPQRPGRRGAGKPGTLLGAFSQGRLPETEFVMAPVTRLSPSPTASRIPSGRATSASGFVACSRSSRRCRTSRRRRFGERLVAALGLSGRRSRRRHCNSDNALQRRAAAAETVGRAANANVG